MKVFESKNIRNIAICGSSGSGKTQLIESILFSHKITNRLGLIEEGNTVSDYDQIEKERSSSVNSSVISFEYEGIKYNFIDTPGYADFYGSAASAIEISDTVLLVINPHEPLDITARKIWKAAKLQNKPVVVYVNFMDNSPNEFTQLIDTLKTLSPNMAPVTAPIGKGEDFKGLIKIIEGSAVIGGQKSEIPSENIASASELSESLMDSVASSDEALVEKFLEEGTLSSEDIKKGLSGGIISGEIIPVLCGSAIKTIGMMELVEFIKLYTPSPTDADSNERGFDFDGKFRALVFKVESQKHVGQVSYIRVFSGALKAGETVYSVRDKKKHRVNQITLRMGSESFNVDEIKCGDICSLVKLDDIFINDTLSADSSSESIKEITFPVPVVERGVYPKAKGDEEKVANAFSSITREDPTISFGFDSSTKEMVLKGIGTLQLELMVKHIRTRYDADIELRPVRIAYKETARKRVDNIRGKYKKQTGGKGQYGDCVIRLEPNELGADFEFADEIVGGKIPSNYIPSIEKGIIDAMKKGVVAGYQVVDIKIAVFDGSYHDVDSSDMAFQIAGSMAFQNAMKESGTYILEPIMKVSIRVSNDYTGAVMGDLNARRGRVLGMNPEGDTQVINAHIPKEMLTTYAEDLRSITSGEGEYSVEFAHYAEAPHDVQEKLIALYQAEREQGR